MTTALNMGAQAAPKINPSNYDQFRNGAVNAVNWLGRQAQWIGSSCKDFGSKVAEFVKPFFHAVMKIVCESFDKVREVVIANKEIAGPAAIGAILLTIVALTFTQVICKPEGGETPKQP